MFVWIFLPLSPFSLNFEMRIKNAASKSVIVVLKRLRCLKPSSGIRAGVFGAKMIELLKQNGRRIHVTDSSPMSLRSGF